MKLLRSYEDIYTHCFYVFTNKRRKHREHRCVYYQITQSEIIEYDTILPFINEWLIENKYEPLQSLWKTKQSNNELCVY